MAPPAVMAAAALYASIDDAYAKEVPPVDMGKVRESIVQVIEEDSEKRTDGSSLAGTFVRLAWHCCGTYRKDDGSGGSNGARMRYSPEKDYGNNAGLDVARNALEPVKAKFPDLSYADLYTYAGVVAIEEAGGPKIEYSTGRVDFEDGSTSDPNDRLPNADYGGRTKNVAGMRAVFNRMGFEDQEIVALLGAHAMGRCHTTASGYWGPWTNAETTFSNEYFRLLLDERYEYCLVGFFISSCFVVTEIFSHILHCFVPFNSLSTLSAGRQSLPTMESHGQDRISLRTAQVRHLIAFPDILQCMSETHEGISNNIRILF
jgi:cytochrome c peroxidase